MVMAYADGHPLRQHARPRSASCVKRTTACYYPSPIHLTRTSTHRIILLSSFIYAVKIAAEMGLDSQRIEIAGRVTPPRYRQARYQQGPSVQKRRNLPTKKPMR